MRRRTAFLIASLVAAIVICTIVVTRQTNSVDVQQTRSSTMSSPNSRPSSISETAPPPEQVIQLWKAGEFQNGVQLYWHTTGSKQYQMEAANRTLDYIVDLGANAVGITFPIYTDGAYPTRVYAGPDTPGTASVELVIQAAQARGLRVALRPTIDEKNIATPQTPLSWRGSIQPPNRSAWFESYGSVLVPYVRLATRYKVQEFVVGTELTSLQTSGDYWQRLNKRLAATGYRGALSYAFNWNGYSPMPYKRLGIDAYPTINLSSSASVVQLTAAIRKWFLQLPLPIRRRMVAQEVGIAAIAGMYPNPWRLGTSSDQLSPEIQVRWFTAMCQAVKQSRLKGIYYWVIDSNADPENPDLLTPTNWIGRPGERSISRCFAPD